MQTGARERRAPLSRPEHKEKHSEFDGRTSEDLNFHMDWSFIFKEEQ